MWRDWTIWIPDEAILLSSCQCLEGPSFFETLIKTLLYVCGTTFVLCLIILLIYFIIYKHKKDSNPLKHALKKAWIWWIIIFIIRIVIIALASR